MEKTQKRTMLRGCSILMTLVLLCAVIPCAFIPVSASESVTRINDLILTVDKDNVKESDAKTINELSVWYKALLDNSPSSTTELGATDKVTAADVTSFNALGQGEKTELANKVAELESALSACVKEGYTPFTSFTTAQNWTWYQKTDDYLRIRFRDKTMHPAWRGGASPMVKFDGLELKFNRMFKNYDTYNFGSGNVSVDNAGISMLFSTTNNYDYEQASTKGFVLYLDAVRGNLVLNFNGNTFYREIIQNSDVLKLDNLEFNAFTVAINATTDAANPYKVTIRTASGQSVSGNIPVEKGSFDAAVLSGGKTYVNFTRGRFDSAGNYLATSYVTYDVIGYRDNTGSAENIDYVNEMIAQLNVDTLTEASAVSVNKMSYLYSKMVPMEKAQITDTAKLEALSAKMLELVKTGYTQYSGISAFTKDWWNTVLSFKDGCAHFVFDQATLSTGLRIGAKAGVEFNGLEIKFNRLIQTDPTATEAGFGIVLANSTAYADSGTFSKGLLLFIDAMRGNLVLNLNGVAKYKDLIVGSDVLKLESLQYNAFSLSFDATEDASNPYKVTINTSDGRNVSALISADCFDAASVMTAGKTYVTFTRGRNNAEGTAPIGTLHNMFDVVGYTNTAAVKRVNSMIEKIPADVTANDGSIVNRTFALYNALSETQKTKVVGVDALTVAVTKYETAFKQSNDNTVYELVNSEADLLSSTKDMNTWWAGSFESKILDNDAGIRLNWINRGLNVRMSLKKSVNLNGLRVQFNRWLQTDGNIAEFAMFFKDASGQQYSASSKQGNNFAIVLNATDGTLKAATSWFRDDNPSKSPEYVNIITSDLLKYDSIGGGKFVVGTDKLQNGDYKVTVTVGTESVDGIIPASVFETVSNDLSTPGQCYLSVSGWSPATQSIDVVSYMSLADVDTYEVNALIASLPEIITLNDCETLDRIYSKYIIASDYQKNQITNLDKFLNAMAMYRSLLSVNMDVFSSEYVALPDAAKWWPSGFSCYGIENDGGIRLSWNGKGRDVRQGYVKKVPLNGLKLQFNALHKTKSVANDPKFTVIVSDALGAAWTYSDKVDTRPLAIVIDTAEGAIYAQPGDVKLFQDDRLKYESIKYKPFTVEINNNDSKLYEVEIATSDWTAKGVIPRSVIDACERFTNPDSCYVTLTVWENSFAEIEWTGIGQSTKHLQITEIIDQFSSIDETSGPAITRAEQMYNALPKYVQDRVSNIKLLESARESYNNLSADNNSAEYVVQQIAKLGTVDITIKDRLDEVEHLYNMLTPAQKSNVTNVQVLEDAVAKYYSLYAEHMDWDSCVYAPLPSSALFANDTIEEWWGDRVKISDAENGGTHFVLANAKRDNRNAFGKYDLDGLNIQIGNFTKTGNGVGTGLLSIMIGPNYTDYGKGLCTTSKRVMAVVLDTNNGTITINPAGNTYYTATLQIMNNPALLYDNLKGKNFSLMFSEVGNGVFQLRVMISDGTLITSIIPSRIICPLKQFGYLDKCYVQVGGWDDHTFETYDLVSIFDKNSKNAVSQVMPVMNAISALPSEVTVNDEYQIRKTVEMYNKLMKKGMKQRVGNYKLLADALLKLSNLWDSNDVDPYDFDMQAYELKHDQTAAMPSMQNAGSISSKQTVTSEKMQSGLDPAIIAAWAACLIIVSTAGITIIKRKKGAK